MIEELRQLLTMIEKMPEMVLHVIFAFGIYKLVMYLSTTGAVVMLVRLAILKLHDYMTQPVPMKFKDRTVNHEARLALELLHDEIVKASATGQYIHASTVHCFIDAYKEKKGLK
jgi:hypothetical protein